MAKKTLAKGINVLIVLLIILFLTLKYQNNRRDNHSVRTDTLTDVRHQMENKIPSLVAKPRKKTIQWFGPSLPNFFGHSKNNVKIELCEFSNCDFLEDYIVPIKGTKVHGPLLADAIVIQGTHINRVGPLRRRNDKQVFVYAERESGRWLPQNVSIEMENSTKHYRENKENAGLFNWTMTYRDDSDIFLPYGEIISRQDAYERGYIQDLNAVTIKDYDQIFYNKTHDAAWIVSDCNTKSKREFYVQKLREHINVDIYGACGSLSCPKRNKTCINEIVKRYKFYLSFENTFYKDYVTEKLFKWFSRDIVQIVYGMANYESIAPSGSVINANDFHSPEELAVYMKQIGSNKQIYVQYLKTKDRYWVIDRKEFYQPAYCKLCEKLNDLDANRRSYANITLWWQLNDTAAFQNLYSQALA